MIMTLILILGSPLVSEGIHYYFLIAVSQALAGEHVPSHPCVSYCVSYCIFQVEVKLLVKTINILYESTSTIGIKWNSSTRRLGGSTVHWSGSLVGCSLRALWSSLL